MSLSKITEICSDLLHNHPMAEKAKEYLNGRLSENLQKEFQFGYFPGEDGFNLLLNHFNETDLIQSGCFTQYSYDNEKILHNNFQNHNLIIPYHNNYGEIKAIVGRSLLEDTERKLRKISKYKNTANFEKRENLFGLYRAKRHIVEKNLVYVVEGQFDYIRATEFGLENVVCLGSSSMSWEQIALLTRYTENIVLVLDKDDAGKAGTKRVKKSFSEFANIESIEIPHGYKDLDEFLSAEKWNGKEFIENSV